MQIPWYWIKEKLSISKELSIENFIEKTSYLGLECEKSSNQQEQLISFMTPSNRKDLNCWWGIVKELSIILQASILDFPDEEDFGQSEKLNFFLERKIEEKKSYFLLENFRSQEESNLLWLENLTSLLKIEKNPPLISISELISLKTGYKIEIKCLNCFVNKNVDEFSTICYKSEKDFLIIVKDSKSSLFKGKQFLYSLLKNIKSISNDNLFNIKTLYLSKDFLNKKNSGKKIDLTHSYLEENLGIKIKEEKIKEILKKIEIGFTVEKDYYSIETPFYREDLLNKEDILEEIGRFFDYNKIPAIAPLIVNNFNYDEFSYKEDLKTKISFYLTSNGFNQLMTYSLIDKNILINNNESNYFKLLNPRSLNHHYYRQFIFPSHIETFARNFGKGFEDFYAFEFSKTYCKREKSEFPIEKEILSISIGNSLVNFEEWRLEWLKNIVENLSLIISGESKIFFKSSKLNFLRENKSFEIFSREENIGFLGIIENSFFKDKNLSEKWFLNCEIEIDKAFKLLKKENNFYKEFSKSPMIKKDISFFVLKGVENNRIYSLIKDFFKNYFVFNIELIDVYEDKSKPEWHSLCFRIEFSDKKKNLNSEEINEIIENLNRSLEKNFEIVRR